MTTEQLLHIAAMYIDEIYAESYPLMKKNREFILSELQKEIARFESTLENGMKELQKILEQKRSEGKKEIDGSANGKPSVLVFVSKQSKTNTVDVTDGVNAKMAELQETVLPADITVEKIRDQSKYIRDNIADVWNAILFGGFLALLITYLFLRNLRATIIGGLCIPTAVISTFFMMKALDFTLNNMSLMALSLAVGILIDCWLSASATIENR